MSKERKHMTLVERAAAWWKRHGSADTYSVHAETAAFIAGWHARGRAERLTKADKMILAAVKRYCRDGDVMHIHDAVQRANLERAKGRK